jgi:hypothetical protein
MPGPGGPERTAAHISGCQHRAGVARSPPAAPTYRTSHLVHTDAAGGSMAVTESFGFSAVS